jgi:hypothetical protein
MNRYTITLVIETPYNPDKWDWTALLDCEPDENIISVYVTDTESETA